MLCVWLFAAACLPAQTPDDVLAYVKLHAPAQWDKYDSLLSQLESHEVISYKLTKAGNNRRKQEVRTVDTFIITNGLLGKVAQVKRIYHIDRDKVSFQHTVMCANDTYSFSLDGGSQPQPDYKLTQYSTSNTEAVRSSINGRSQAVAYAWRPNGSRVDDWWSRANWKVISCKSIATSKQLEIIAVNSIPSDGKITNVTYTVLVNPMHGWRVEQYRIQNPLVLDVTMRMTYSDNDDPVPHPTRVDFSETTILTGEQMEATIEIPVFRKADVDKAVFSLSAFGLPEPVGVEPPTKPTPVYVWLLAAAAGFAVVALVFRWLMLRRLRSHVPTTASS